MGVLTDLIIADKSDAEIVANSIGPTEEWKGFDAKGHNEITLGHLLCILRGEEFDETVWDEFPLLAQATEDGPWVFDLPDDLTVKLSQLNEDEIPAVVSEWLADNDDMKGFDNNYAESFIREFKLLAAESINEQKPILMWMCL